MAHICIYSKDEEKAFWDEENRKVILPDKTEHIYVSAYPDSFGKITSLVEFKKGSYLATDCYYHRLLLIKKDIVKPFGPVLNAPFSVAYTQGYIYVATQPNGIIEPSVITVIDESENILGQMYLDHHVEKNKSYMMYAKDYLNPKLEPEKPFENKSRIESIKSDGKKIEITFKNNENISFDADTPENAMLTNIGWRYVISTSRNIRTKKSIFSYSIDNLSNIDFKNTSIQPSDEPAFQNNIKYTIENNDKKDIYIYGFKNNDMDFSNMPSLLNSILKGCDTDTSKAYAIWDFTRKHMLKGITWPQCSFKNDGKFSAIRFLNSMGSGACGSFNGLFSLLAQSAGIPAKTGSLSNGSHAALRLLLNMKDTYVDALYGGCAPFHGSVIPSEDDDICTYSELCEDPYLLHRASDESVYELASMIGYKDGWIDGWAEDYSDPYTMGYFLKPKEKMEFTYSFNGTYTGPLRPHANILTGKKIINLERNEFVKNFFELNKMKTEGNVFSCEAKADAWYLAQCPYPITGILIEGRLYKGSLTISTDYTDETFEYSKRQEFCAYFGNKKNKSLNNSQNSNYIKFKAFKAQYRIYSITLFFQANRVTLCSLVSGINNLQIEADKGKLRITHEYIQSSMPRPKAPVLKKKPQGIFEWSADDAVNCEFILSKEPECIIPYSPIFHQVTQKTSVEIDCTSILKPDIQYYWKVRSKNRYGIWGPWSAIMKFTYLAPKKPEGITLNIKDRDITLSWIKDKQVSHYQIYGSNELAFIPSESDYTININRTDMTAKKIVCPKNYITETKTASIKLTSDNLIDNLKYCYRVIAVDKLGTKSVSSEFAALPHPWINVESISDYAYSGCAYSSYIKCVSSIGKMRFNRTDDNPMYTDYTDADIITFELDGPSWLKVRSYDGYLYGTADLDDIGINKFILRAVNKNKQKDEICFTVNVMEGV